MLLFIRKQKVIIICVVVFTMFIVLTFNFMNVLIKYQNEVIQINLHVEDEINKVFLNLPNIYRYKQQNSDIIINNFIKFVNIRNETYNLNELWKKANSWIFKSQIYDIHPQLGSILFALKNTKIIKADLDKRGSQLKFLLTLEGNQEIVFKPKRYEKDEIIDGVVYAGKDRYGAEILGFYLSGILEKFTVPLSVERITNIKHDLLPVATKNFMQTILTLNNKTCIYGLCYYCTKKDPVCGDANYLLPGAAIFNIKNNMKIYKSPWRRTYKKGKYAEWQTNNNYCNNISKTVSSKRIYDFIDISIFDFLIQNGDRHHYEVLNGNLVWLDNGKGLGNPNVDHIDILAPLYQCCQLRANTWKRLKLLSGGLLTQTLKSMPDIQNFVSEAHFEALERRLLIVYAAVEYCISINKGKTITL